MGFGLLETVTKFKNKFYAKNKDDNWFKLSIFESSVKALTYYNFFFNFMQKIITFLF